MQLIQILNAAGESAMFSEVSTTSRTGHPPQSDLLMNLEAESIFQVRPFESATPSIRFRLGKSAISDSYSWLFRAVHEDDQLLAEVRARQQCSLG